MPQLLDVAERYDVSELPDAGQLPVEDGEPLESNWHRIQINLLIELASQRLHNREMGWSTPR